MLWFAYQPRVTSAATDLRQAGTTALPSGSPSAMAPAPSISAAPLPSQTPEAPPEEKQELGAEQPEDPESGSGSGSGSGGSGGGSEREPDTKPTTKKPAAAKGFAIIGKGSNRCVDVTDAKNGKGKDGTPLQIWDCAGTANQKWDFRGDGTVRSLGLCMDVAWGSRDDGAVIQLARCSGNPAQQFVLSTAGDLVNPQADKCVDVKDNATGDGARLLLWTCAGTPNQKWRVK